MCVAQPFIYLNKRFDILANISLNLLEGSCSNHVCFQNESFMVFCHNGHVYMYTCVCMLFFFIYTNKSNQTLIANGLSNNLLSLFKQMI